MKCIAFWRSALYYLHKTQGFSNVFFFSVKKNENRYGFCEAPLSLLVYEKLLFLWTPPPSIYQFVLKAWCVKNLLFPFLFSMTHVKPFSQLESTQTANSHEFKVAFWIINYN